jgi:hypothetical protein
MTMEVTLPEGMTTGRRLSSARSMTPMASTPLERYVTLFDSGYRSARQARRA